MRDQVLGAFVDTIQKVLPATLGIEPNRTCVLLCLCNMMSVFEPYGSNASLTWLKINPGFGSHPRVEGIRRVYACVCVCVSVCECEGEGEGGCECECATKCVAFSSTRSNRSCSFCKQLSVARQPKPCSGQNVDSLSHTLFLSLSLSLPLSLSFYLPRGYAIHNPEPHTQGGEVGKEAGVPRVNPKPSTQDPRPSTPNPQPQTPHPQPQTHNPKPQTLNPKHQTLHPEP